MNTTENLTCADCIYYNPYSDYCGFFGGSNMRDQLMCGYGCTDEDMEQAEKDLNHDLDNFIWELEHK